MITIMPLRDADNHCNYVKHVGLYGHMISILYHKRG